MVQVLNQEMNYELGQLTADGSTSDFETISVSVKIISAMYCAR